MPVAAKFSEAFYQKFGHDATGELVEYLNTIDTTYRTELDRLNDLNWNRVAARIAQVETRIDHLEARVAALLDQRISELRTELGAEFRTTLADLRADLIKWMFLFWLGTIGTVIALQQLPTLR